MNEEKEINLRRTQDKNGGWTVETLREYVMSVLNGHDEKYAQRFEDIKASISLSFTTLQATMQAAFESQKEAVAAAFYAQRDAMNAALVAAERAVNKAEVASEKRFDSVNEFRNTLADQQRNLMPRSEVEVILKSMNDKIGAVERMLNVGSGTKSGIKEGWGYAAGVLGLILFILSILRWFGK